MAKESAALSTKEYPKGSGIRVRELLNVNGSRTFSGSYLVTVPAKITGRLRQRKQFKAKSEAERWAETQFRGYRKQGEDFFSLTEPERREVASCLPALRKHGISISEAVRFAVKHLRPDGRTKTVRNAVDELLASKMQRFGRGDLRERSFDDFRQRAERFAEAFPGRIASEVSASDLKAWVVNLRVGTGSNQNYLAVVGEVFKFATQRRYVAFSPLDDLTDIDRKELCGGHSDGREPSILTPGQADRLINAAMLHQDLGLLGAIALALFCGLRTEEIKRLEWDQVRLMESPPVVIIGAKIAKKRRIRHVEIPANAVLWLSLIPGRVGAVTRNTHANDYQLRFRKLLNLAKFHEWETNAMRHSFGSYHYALYGNPLETSRLLGHKGSDEVLFTHYRALAGRAEAKAYFEICPPTRNRKIVEFA